MVNNVKKIGSYFIKTGVRKNDVVVLFMTNNVYYPVIVHAIMGIGAIASPCNPAYKPGAQIYFFPSKMFSGLLKFSVNNYLSSI